MEIAVRDELPVWGVDIILGNDLVTDGRMWPDDERPVLTPRTPEPLLTKQQQLSCSPVLASPGGAVTIPVSVQTDLSSSSLNSKGITTPGAAVPQRGVQQQPDEVEEAPSAVCVVTHAMATALPTDSGVNWNLTTVLSCPVPNSLCISSAELVEEQKKDPSLKDPYESVVPFC